MIADLELADVFHELIREPAIAEKRSRSPQLERPETETELVVVSEIPFDPPPHVGTVGHLGVEDPRIRVAEDLEQRRFVREGERSEAESFGFEIPGDHGADVS